MRIRKKNLEKNILQCKYVYVQNHAKYVYTLTWPLSHYKIYGEGAQEVVQIDLQDMEATFRYYVILYTKSICVVKCPVYVG